MNKKTSIVAIFREFLSSYPRHFGLLFMLLVVEGIAAVMLVLATVPMVDICWIYRWKKSEHNASCVECLGNSRLGTHILGAGDVVCCSVRTYGHL